MARILIIEDYPDMRDMTELILTEVGHTISSAGDGLSGFELAVHEQPDLILMDLALPFLTGWEATRRLKANPATRHIPIVAFTAYVSQHDIARTLAVGCSAVIPKPFELDTLVNEVAAVLAQPSAHRKQRAIGTERVK
jgi:two-component system, cell cycle response regulator DivK